MQRLFDPEQTPTPHCRTVKPTAGASEYFSIKCRRNQTVVWVGASTHVRVADETAFFGLPEGQRGIFVGGGGSVRISRLLGVARMTDLMLTGRLLKADEAERYNLVQYVVPKGQALAKAKELAERICKNAPLSNFAITNSLPRVLDMSYDDGLFVERLISEYTRSPESMERLRAFLDKKAPRIRVPD